MTHISERTIRLTGIMLALVVASALNGGLLWKFDDMAQNPSLAYQSGNSIVLQPVTIVGRQS